MRLAFVISSMIIIGMFVSCDGNIIDDEPKTPELKVSDVLKDIQNENTPFPASEIAKLDSAKETELLNSLAEYKFNPDDVLKIAIIRKNQGNFEPALRWLSMKLQNNEKFIEIRYRKAQVLFLMGKLKEAYILCKLETLPDEVTTEFRGLFKDLSQQIESELRLINKGSEKN